MFSKFPFISDYCIWQNIGGPLPVAALTAHQQYRSTITGRAAPPLYLRREPNGKSALRWLVKTLPWSACPSWPGHFSSRGARWRGLRLPAHSGGFRGARARVLRSGNVGRAGTGRTPLPALPRADGAHPDMAKVAAASRISQLPMRRLQTNRNIRAQGTGTP